jgi:hypothetical protein
MCGQRFGGFFRKYTGVSILSNKFEMDNSFDVREAD